MTKRWAVAGLAAALATGACGDDGSAEGAGASQARSGTGCNATALQLTAQGKTVELTDAVAVVLADGKAITLWLSDIDLPREFDTWTMPEVADDAVLASLAITAFNADLDALETLAAGQEITYTDEFGVRTFVVTGRTPQGQLANPTGASGTTQLTSVGDEVCGTVDYHDGEKSLTGTFRASVVD